MYKKKSVRKIADDYIQKNKNKTRGGHDRGSDRKTVNVVFMEKRR